MEHLSADRLAALATDPTVQPGSREVEHLDSCRACRDDVSELSEVARTVSEARSTTLRPPHPDVWAAIAREVGTQEVGVQEVGTQEDRTAAAGRPGRHSRTWLAVAAAAGLVVGAGAVLGVQALGRDDGTSLVARTDLAALPGETGQGTAELVRQQDALQLRVHAALQATPGTDYREVWLVNGDGRRMYALGVLPSSGDASYWLPTPLSQQLDGYSIVDISLEPDDGDTAHSRHSVVRGQLPG